jgi:iron(III) transport system substrate-binding protein
VNAEFHRAPGTRLGITFEEEMNAGAPTADLMNHSVPTKMIEYAKKGWFLKHHIPNEKDYLWVGEYPKGPLQLGYWYPWIGATMSPFYNTKALGVKPPRDDWMDLTDKRFAGKMTVVNMGAGGSPIMYWMMLREKYGLAYWKKIAALKPTIFPSHGNVFKDALAGEHPLGLFLHQSTVMRNIHTKKAPLKIVWPKGPDGKLLIPQIPMGIGIVNHKKLHKNAAKLFMNWLTSRKGQEQVKNASWRWAMNPHVSAPPHFDKTLKEINPYWPDFDKFKNVSKEWVNDWNRIFKL